MCYFVRVDRVDCYFGPSGWSDWKTTSVPFLYVTSCFKLEAPYFPCCILNQKKINRMYMAVLQVQLQTIMLPPSNHISQWKDLLFINNSRLKPWKISLNFFLINHSHCWSLISSINLNTTTLTLILWSHCAAPPSQRVWCQPASHCTAAWMPSFGCNASSELLSHCKPAVYIQSQMK